MKANFIPVPVANLKPGDTILVPSSPGFALVEVERVEGKNVFVSGHDTLTGIWYEIGNAYREHAWMIVPS